MRSSIFVTTVYSPGEKSFDLVAHQRETGAFGPRCEQTLDVGDGEFAAFGAMPRVIFTGASRAEQHLVHHGRLDVVRGGHLADLVGDRGDQYAAEVEHDRANVFTLIVHRRLRRSRRWQSRFRCKPALTRRSGVCDSLPR